MRSTQPDLLASLGQTPPDTAPLPRKRITYERRKKQWREDSVADTGLRFDDNVPVETIVLPPAELDGVSDGEWVTISEKATHRLAQRPGSYVVLKYVRPVIQRQDTGELTFCLLYGGGSIPPQVRRSGWVLMEKVLL